VEQVREVGVSLDGMVGKGIRVLSSWVGFSWLEGERIMGHEGLKQLRYRDRW